MNADERAYVLLILRWVHVLGMLTMGFFLLFWARGARFMGTLDNLAFLLFVLAVTASAALVRHWLTLRWKRE